MKKVYGSVLFLCVLLFLADTPCQAEKDILIAAMGTQPLQVLNPAHTTNRQTLVLYHNWGDTLLYRDPVARVLVPCLAESYQWLEPTLLEFSLRKGVRFHNGEPFHARAVAFSLDLLKGSDSVVARFLHDFTGVEVVDDHTVRFRMASPTPTALELITNVLFIYPPEYFAEVGKDGFEKQPVGTGPYRFVSRNGPSEVYFRASPDYFGGPKGKARIPHLKVMSMPEELYVLQGLVWGSIDMVRATAFLQRQIPFLKEVHSLVIQNADLLRKNFLTMDATGRSQVPFFKDRRVRMAVNHAIDRDRIILNSFLGHARRADSVTSPLHFGHEPDVETYDYNPARARELLAEAGYPDGFTVDFFASISEEAAENIARDLRAVGIETRFHWMGGKWDLFYEKFLRGEMPLALVTWGSYSIFDASAILDPFFMNDAEGCYGTTPEINDLLTEAGQTLDQEKRRHLFSQAQKRIAHEAFWVPICTTQAVLVMNKNLNFQPAYDEIDRYFLADWE